MSKRGKRGQISNSMFDPYSTNQARDRLTGMDVLYQQKLVELSASRFKWLGLPETIDTRFLELTLLQSGGALFFYDDVNSRYLVTRMAYMGPMNIYDNPTSFTAVGNSFSRTLGPKECVPIWPNKLRTPDMLVIATYANRLAQADRTIDINMLNLRHPVLIATSEGQRLSYINAFNQVVDGQPVIVGTPEFGSEFGDAVQAINLNGANSDKATMTVQVAKHDIWNDCMTFLGINNATQDKKERLVTDEVSANDSQVLGFRQIGLECRNQAADQINRMFDLSVSVEWNSAVADQAVAPEPADWEEE